MKKIKNIFIDFNGTLLDDVNLCLDLLNLFLKEQNKPLIELNIYKHIFTFPIYDYYILAGLDFKNESFDSIANRFIIGIPFDCLLNSGISYPFTLYTLPLLVKNIT